MRNEHFAADHRRDRTEAGARFGTIGISAVAAALRYRGDVRNPAYAPSRTAQDRHADERAA